MSSSSSSSSSQFVVAEHTIPCQHIREYPAAVKNQQDVLHLVVKEYRPLNNLEAEPGSLTIIATHANGFPKETYEPLWEDLIQASAPLKIRAIWVADCSHQGASGVKNENLQGDDLIQRVAPLGPNAAMLASLRTDRWPSGAKAEDSLGRSPFFKTWDRRAFSKYLQYGLRETPTALYPESSLEDDAGLPLGAVTLTTTKHQEAWSYVRSNFATQSADPNDPGERLMSPELDPESEGTWMFVRPESMLTLLNLPQLRPSVLWIYGALSPINVPSIQDEKMRVTGTGVGGSGGAKLGRVEQAFLKGTAHLVPFEKVKDCADTMAGWLGKELERFNAEQTFYENHKSGKSEKDMRILSKQWMKAVRLPADVKRPLKEKL
ncbi:MAG: hypothetical protein M1837_006896 [Sclerophora amabilis]|nr:MAG: hypothetical protein M1837_006896 [Sclerophora amabilis]